MTPTTQQAAFLTALRTTSSNLALVARAGCGKTSTIMLGVAQEIKRNPRLEVLVCAFNKAIEVEISEKLTAAGYDWRQAQAKTAHSLGFGLLKFAFKPSIDDKKVRRLIEARNEDGVFVSYAQQIEALVGYAKQAGFGFFSELAIGNAAAWYDLADHYDVNGLDDTSEADAVVEAAQLIYRQSLAQTDVVDFNDMILFPLVKNLRVKFGKDLIFVDEAQDLSRARQALIRKFLKPNTGRMVVVGDDRQAIYGFTGADAAALPNLIELLHATQLPLSVTWRCPRAVVALAQSLVPDIEAAPGAAEGRVTDVDGAEATGDLIASLGPKDAVLCRNMAPLIEIAFKMIRAGKPVKVEGRNIGDGLVALVQRWKVKTIDTFLQRLEAYRDREVQKAMAKGNESKQAEVEDRCDTLHVIASACIEEGKTTVSDMVAWIQNLFADQATNATVCATYHRSKGREWPRVILWEHSERCPSRAARQPWQREQEDNLAYVAFTRAQSELVLVSNPNKKLRAAA
jgi:superfamily I DNA/RNA helicase